jgi:hypothetical protein
MVRTGTVTGRQIRKNRDGTDKRLMLQVQFTNKADIRTVEYVPLPGQDENPINGTRVFVITVAEAYHIAIGANDKVKPDTETGEKRIYSTNDDGVLQAFIKLLKTGVIHINGDNDFAVRFDALDAALQIYVAQVNVALGTKLDGGGAAGTTSLDISGAKVDNVKLA